jgi:hypothetical protein
MNKEKNEKCMQAPTFEANAPDLATQKWLRQSETLKKLGYEWVNDYQVWASQINYSLPVLDDSHARALADSIHDFLKS